MSKAAAAAAIVDETQERGTNARGALAARRVRRLARADVDANKCSLAVRVTALRLGLVLLDRKTAGDARDEGHLCRGARLDGLLDVITVQVHDDAPIRRPAQLDRVALAHPDRAHVLRHVSAHDANIEDDVGRLGSGYLEQQADANEEAAAQHTSWRPNPRPEPAAFLPTPTVARIRLPLERRSRAELRPVMMLVFHRRGVASTSVMRLTTQP